MAISTFAWSGASVAATSRVLGVKRQVGRAIDVAASEFDFAVERIVRAAPTSGDVIVAGFLHKSSGIGRSARHTLAALEALSGGVTGHDIGALFRSFTWRPAAPAPLSDAATLLLVCNPPEALSFFGRTGRRWWGGKRRIGYWVWELPEVPEEWRRISKFFHEIWVPSPHVAAALSGIRTPVRYIPYPIPDLSSMKPNRARFGLPENAAVFLTMADANSSFTRKNPLGALTAFETAFPQPSPHALLVVKLQGDATGERLTCFREAAARRPDIRLLHEQLSDSDSDALIASSDVVVSLHRAEGFGLPLAEALAMGRAVLATGWSGNMAFMDGLEAALVDFELVRIHDPDGVYLSSHQVWAEPDLRVAAAKIERMATDPALRQEIGAQGRERIAKLRQRWAAEIASMSHVFATGS